MSELKLPKNKFEPGKGRLLVSSPELHDVFNRTVILITEHNESGSVGFVLNKELKLNLSDAVPELADFDAPVFLGGPVQQEMLNFFHRIPDKIADGYEIADGIFWGGNFETLKILASTGSLNKDDFVFFLGYSGWGEDQLEQELKLHTWYVTSMETDDVFDNESKNALWSKVLKRMGGDYTVISTFPEDPIVN